MLGSLKDGNLLHHYKPQLNSTLKCKTFECKRAVKNHTFNMAMQSAFRSDSVWAQNLVNGFAKHVKGDVRSARCNLEYYLQPLMK